jgi:hypothetical protein
MSPRLTEMSAMTRTKLVVPCAAACPVTSYIVMGPPTVEIEMRPCTRRSSATLMNLMTFNVCSTPRRIA